MYLQLMIVLNFCFDISKRGTTYSMVSDEYVTVMFLVYKRESILINKTSRKIGDMKPSGAYDLVSIPAFIL